MIDPERRAALASLRFNWAPTPDDVWRPAPFHVDGLHPAAERAVLDGLSEARRSEDSSPIGVAILGQRGMGKTHLLGWIRERVQADEGYFFLVSVLDSGAFWRSTTLSFLDGLTREVPERDTQLKEFLRRLADRLGAPRTLRRAVTGETELSRPALDAFADMLRKSHRQIGVDCQDTLRALVLRASENFTMQDVGHNFLCSNDEEEPGERNVWGIRRGKRSAQEIVRDMSRLLALTGPTVVAIDQIDLIIAQSAKSTDEATQDWRQSLIVEQIAGGLMSLRESTRRTFSVVACLPISWDLIKAKATDTVRDRFRESIKLRPILDSALARELVHKRVATAFNDIGFTSSPHETWPVMESAFADAVNFTPRELLITIDDHVRACLLDDEERELARFKPGAKTVPELPAASLMDATPESMSYLDKKFAALVERADPTLALSADHEDFEVPRLLSAGLSAWIIEQGSDGAAFSHDPLPGKKPALHARLRQSLNDAHEDEAHWSFRAIGASHAVAALNRIRTAVTAAGLTEGVTKRRLFLLRNVPWSPGPRTKEVVAAFEAAGGRRLDFPAEDVKILIALRELLNEPDLDAVHAWIASHKPTRELRFLREAIGKPIRLAEPATDTGGTPPDEAQPARNTADEPVRQTASGIYTVPIGSALGGRREITIGLEALRRHTAIFAGSGSGKTVLIRRLVEECALAGVSAIVLDPNNDLARLGDPWPEPPTSWGNGDASKATEYFRSVEVVVWTPLRESGRPLAFLPLPDFSSVVDSSEELRTGVDAAVAALAPRARMDGSTSKADRGRAVLREALAYYARKRRSDLAGFIDLLTDLPLGVSGLETAGRLASEISQNLYAATINDPLFGGGGTPVDPGVLLTPSAGKAARISVISLVGLPLEEQRQGFVNQLQLALFAWIKRNPANDRPLGGLFVMDEAQTLAPSGSMTVCTESTLALASQARKYGLGLVFATQAPRALHNQVSGNAATQFFGLLNHSTQIAAAKDLARNKGGDLPDIGRLGPGQFYAAIEGSAFQRIQVPLCLSHHPKSPLTEEEVIQRAAKRG